MLLTPSDQLNSGMASEALLSPNHSEQLLEQGILGFTEVHLFFQKNHLLNPVYNLPNLIEIMV